MEKTIFITGAASGIGRETALFFANRGWFVGIADLNGPGLGSLVSEIGEDKCFSCVVDVCDAKNVQEGIDGFAKTCGRGLDVLVNNAGILSFGLFENIPLARHHKIVDVNFKGVLTCIHCALPYLKNRPGSMVINMSSASALYGIPDLAVYSATKHAVSAMTEALNLEFLRHGIWVCDIQPPYVKTPLIDTAEPVFSLGRMGVRMEPGDVAACVWKAVHKRRLHWRIGSTFSFSLLKVFFPFLTRFIVKYLALPSD